MKHFFICDDTNPKEVVELCRKSGFGIEIQGFYRPEALVDSDLIEKTVELTNEISPKCLHGPFGDLCPGSWDNEVMDLARKRFEQAWSVAKRFDATHIVFHHGYVPNTSFPSGWLKRWPKFWKAFLQDKDSSIRIHIENHLDTEPNLISDAVALVENDILDINLDIGHVNFTSNLPIVEWIEKLGCQIGYAHLHDNHGEKDEH